MKDWSFTLLAACRHCGVPIPINGPWQSVRCEACRGQNDFTPQMWAKILEHVGQRKSEVRVDPYRMEIKHVESPPKCEECGEPLPELVPGPVQATLACSRCGAETAHGPPPPWLQERIPGLRSWYGALQPEGPGLAAEPVVFSCPSCGAGLTITDRTRRTSDCDYCRAQVHLPDDVWRRLHPARKMRAWGVSADDRGLKTPERLEREAAAERSVELYREEVLERERSQQKTANRLAKKVGIALAVTLGASVIVIGLVLTGVGGAVLAILVGLLAW